MHVSRSKYRFHWLRLSSRSSTDYTIHKAQCLWKRFKRFRIQPLWRVKKCSSRIPLPHKSKHKVVSRVSCSSKRFSRQPLQKAMFMPINDIEFTWFSDNCTSTRMSLENRSNLAHLSLQWGVSEDKVYCHNWCGFYLMMYVKKKIIYGNISRTLATREINNLCVVLKELYL